MSRLSRSTTHGAGRDVDAGLFEAAVGHAPMYVHARCAGDGHARGIGGTLGGDRGELDQFIGGEHAAGEALAIHVHHAGPQHSGRETPLYIRAVACNDGQQVRLDDLISLG